MKKILINTKNIALSLLLTTTLAFGDSNYISYQGVALNSGAAVASSKISLLFTILQNDGATIVYQEKITDVATTDKGFFSHQIGNGIKTAGTVYSSISWVDGYKLKVEVDYANGTSYTDLGTQEFTSSVYTLKAKTSDSATTAVTTSGNAATATALASNPSDCTSGKFATGIAADGDLTCSTPSYIADTNTDTNTQNTINNTLTSTSTTQSLSAAQGKVLNDSLGTATNANTASTIVKRDASGNFSAGTITANLTGTASTATSAITVKIQANNAANEDMYIPFVTNTGNAQLYVDSDGVLTFNPANNKLSTSSLAVHTFNVSANSNLVGTLTVGSTLNVGSTTTMRDTLYITGADIIDYTTGTHSSTHATVVAYDKETDVGLIASSHEIVAYTGAEGIDAVTTSLLADHAVAGAVFLAYSDKRIKENIRPVQNSLEIINKLNPVSYTKIDKLAYGNRKEYGFIAQEVKEVIPSAVSLGTNFIPVLKKLSDISLEKGVKYKIQISKDGENTKEEYTEGTPLPEGDIYVISKEVDDFHSIEYDVLYTHAIAAIQEQQQEISSLKDQLAQIINALKANGIELK
ncbi:MAG: hypothetical protein GQ570_04395 [Helicobacteraceae bacterium]|nr:hypothetical protein [Helicobacteraceae bacterium]